jgi:hypothetical protein
MRTVFGSLSVWLISSIAYAQHSTDYPGAAVGYTGVSSIWVLANISYAGMRAQHNRSIGWRILAFIFGFPGTLLSFMVIREGSERAYGVDLPRRIV